MRVLRAVTPSLAAGTLPPAVCPRTHSHCSGFVRALAFWHFAHAIARNLSAFSLSWCAFLLGRVRSCLRLFPRLAQDADGRVSLSARHLLLHIPGVNITHRCRTEMIAGEGHSTVIYAISLACSLLRSLKHRDSPVAPHISELLDVLVAFATGQARLACLLAFPFSPRSLSALLPTRPLAPMGCRFWLSSFRITPPALLLRPWWFAWTTAAGVHSSTQRTLDPGVTQALGMRPLMFDVACALLACESLPLLILTCANLPLALIQEREPWEPPLRIPSAILPRSPVSAPFSASAPVPAPLSGVPLLDAAADGVAAWERSWVFGYDHGTEVLPGEQASEGGEFCATLGAGQFDAGGPDIGETR